MQERRQWERYDDEERKRLTREMMLRVTATVVSIALHKAEIQEHVCKIEHVHTPQCARKKYVVPRRCAVGSQGGGAGLMKGTLSGRMLV